MKKESKNTFSSYVQREKYLDRGGWYKKTMPMPDLKHAQEYVPAGGNPFHSLGGEGSSNQWRGQNSNKE